MKAQIHPLAQGRKLNARRSIPDSRDLQLHEMHGLLSLPTKVDLREFCPPIYDQGQEGDCTSNGWRFAWEFLQLRDIRLGLPLDNMEFGASSYTPVSTRFHYRCETDIEGDPGVDNGAQIMTGGKVFARYGACRDVTWPSNTGVGTPEFLSVPAQNVYTEAAAHRRRTYYRLANFQCILQNLAYGFPVVGGYDLYDSFMSPYMAQTGIGQMPVLGEKFQGGHCMAIVGYDQSSQTLLVRNSWGTDWGQEGYCTLKFDYFKNSNLFFDPVTLRPN